MRVVAGLLGALLLLAALPPLVSDVARLLGPGGAQPLISFADLVSRLPAGLIEADGLAAIQGSRAVASLLRLPAGPSLAVLGLLLATLSRVGRRANGRCREALGAGQVAERSDAAHARQPSAALSTTTMDAVDREFLPAALELLETPPSPIRVAAIWLICAAFATALAWSYLGWLDILPYPDRVPGGRVATELRPMGGHGANQGLETIWGRVSRAGVFALAHPWITSGRWPAAR